MKEELTLSFIQPDIVWNNIAANLAKYSRIISTINKGTDLILLPEMFSTGFNLNPLHLAEGMDGRTVQWMNATAVKRNCSIAGSLIIKDGNQYFNRIIVVSGKGEIASYDKRHLFRMEGEETHYTPGNQKLISNLDGWRISFQICYDLRFPVWTKNLNDYDILVNVANWPAKRNDIWNTLLKARAIENQAYVIGVNRIGVDGNGISYSGESQVVDPKGNLLHHLGSAIDTAITCTLSLREITEFREKFPVWRDWDDFSIHYR